LFNDDKLEGKDAAKWVCSPPLRKLEDQQRLWQGLQNGIIQTIATDHCPFFYNGNKPILYEGVSVAIPGKELGKGNFTRIPNGNPAKIFGLYPQKGTLAVGSDADIVLWDPQKKIKYGISYSQQRTDYNLYEGRMLTGFPILVFSRGKLIMREGEWFGKPGQGRYLPRQKFTVQV
jgi:dihydropyrimidinase